MPRHYSFLCLIVAATATLAGCSGSGPDNKPLITGSLFGASKPTAPDPMAGLKQVASTSAKAARCGFYFDAAKLKSGALAAEAAKNPAPEAAQKADQLYEYTRTSVGKLLDEAGSCSQGELTQVREDLPRYLAGDFSPRQEKQVNWSITDIGQSGGVKAMDRDKVFAPASNR